MNKDTQQLLRKVRKQGAKTTTREGGKLAVHGPDGFYILHMGMSAGSRTDMQKKGLRRIGFHV